MHQFNPYLSQGESNKGREGLLEDAARVENIVFQTRSGPLDAFEQRLADGLTAAFLEGCETLSDVATALNAQACFDREGRAWTEPTLETQLALSAALLFQPVADEAHD